MNKVDKTKLSLCKRREVNWAGDVGNMAHSSSRLVAHVKIKLKLLRAERAKLSENKDIHVNPKLSAELESLEEEIKYSQALKERAEELKKLSFEVQQWLVNCHH